MSCESCVQKIKAANEADKKILEQAAEMAKQTGETYAIYKNEHGQVSFIPAGQSAGYPITGYISPFNTDTAI